MKKNCLPILFMLFSCMLYSQPWLNNLPHEKFPGELTISDYRNAFEEYWRPFNVDKGYYYENGVKKKAVGWKQYRRWEFEMEGEVDPSTGKFPDRTALEIYEEYMRIASVTDPSSDPNWTPLGPNTSGGGYAGVGRINCIAFHPTDNNTYWVGAASGGLWVTINNGSSWTCLTDNQGVLAVSDILVASDFITSHTIFIATGDKDHWDNRSIGVLKSTNGGISWSSTGISYQLADYDMVNRLLQDPNNTQIIIAATSNGVFKTTNGGATWNTQLTSVNFIDMEYKPGDFNTFCGSTTNGSIYLSSNGGTSWTQVFSNSSAGRIELAVSPNQSAWVYALVAGTDSGLLGIYKSVNSGATFSEVFSGSTLNLLGWDSSGNDTGGQAWYDLTIAVSPSNANVVLTGGVNTWRSTNGGSSWTIVNHWWGDGVPAVHADKHMLIFRSNGNLFECNDGGVYLSTNDGTSWTDKTNGMAISQMYRLGVSQTASTEVITGLQDNGSKVLSGGAWFDIIGGDGMECLIDYSNVNIQYGTLYYGDIYRTTNHWNSETLISPSGAGEGAWVTPYVIDPTNPQILYAGYADVWKTTDRGNSWTKISTISSSGKIRNMAIAPSNTQVLYAAESSVLWKTTNGGTSWSNITSGLPVGSGSITSIAVKNDDAGTLWVSLGGYNTNRVFQSADGGGSWTNITAGLPSIPAFSVVQNKQSASEVQLYVGTELGVYFKKGPLNWVPFNTGLPNVRIGEIEIYYATSPQNSKLRAATYGRGLWETPVYYGCTPPVPTITGLSTVCQGVSGVNYTTEPGMTYYSWAVSSGGIITSGSGTNQITVTWNVPGTQTVSVNYYNASLCTAANPTDYMVMVYPVPAPTITGTGSTCAGTSGHVYSTEPGMTGYAWSVSAGGVITAGSGTSQVTVTWNSGGPQAISVNYINSYSCTAPSATSQTVNVFPAPSAVIIPDGPTSICQGNSVTLTASTATLYLWSTGATAQSIVVSTSGNYSVTVTDGNSCTAASSPTTVTVNANPVAYAGEDQAINYGISTTLSGTATGGSGNYTWHWEPASLLVDANVQNPVTVNMTSSMLFILSAYDIASGCTGIDQMLVTVTGGLLSVEAMATPSAVCAGDVIQLTALISGGTGDNTYAWTSDPAGFSSTLPTPVAFPDITTTYFVTVNDGFSTVTDSVTVTAIQIPAVPDTPSGPDTVDVNTVTTSDYVTVAISSADTYTWGLNPADAGTISGTDTTGTVTWNAGFTGTAFINVTSVNTCGESSWSNEKQTVVENTATGIGQNNLQFSVLVYPNPANDLLNVELPGYLSFHPAFIEICEIRGQCLGRVTVCGIKTLIDVSGLAPGLYMLGITTDEGVRFVKFVKTTQ